MLQPTYRVKTKIIGPNDQVDELSDYFVTYGDNEHYRDEFNSLDYYVRHGLIVSIDPAYPMAITFNTQEGGEFSGYNPAVWAGRSIEIVKYGFGSTFRSVLFPFPTFFPGGGGNANNVVVKQLGITFSLDTSGDQFQAIKNKISGYSYVRLKREQADSTRLGTGYLQPTHSMESDDKYILTSFEVDSSVTDSKWAFDIGKDTSARDGRQVRLGLQIYYAPNFVGQSLAGYSTGDYLRFIGRTYDYGYLLRYAAKITTPDFGTNNAYYIASNDYTYNYDDSTLSIWMDNVPQAVSTNSFAATNNIFPIKTRVSIPYSTNGNEATIDALVFRNMASTIPDDAAEGNYTEWGTQCIGVTFNDAINNFPNTTAIFRPSNVQIPFYLVSYERYLIEQYGGWSRADR